MAVRFNRAHIPKDISFLGGVRWCVAYPLRTRHVEALMQECAVSVDDATINW
jgi:transposase-like protein